MAQAERYVVGLDISETAAQIARKVRTLTLVLSVERSPQVAHSCRIRPYCAESTASHPNSEVKLRQAVLVLGWATTRESTVPYPFDLTEPQLPKT